MTLSCVLQREPEWSHLPSSVSPSLSVFLNRCLEKDPKQRVHDIADVRLAMAGAFETGATPVESVLPPQLQVWQRPVAVAGIVVVAVLVTALAAVTMMRPEPNPSPVPAQFAIVPPDTAPLNLGGASFATSRSLLMELRSSTSRAGRKRRHSFFSVASTSSMSPPAWGGGGSESLLLARRRVGRFCQRRCRQDAPEGLDLRGPPVMLTESLTRILGASWGADDEIIFGRQGAGCCASPEAVENLRR